MIIMVGGSKGGVGKSTVSMALIHYFREMKQKPVFAIDADTQNPDIYKMYYDKDPDLYLIASEMDSHDGWLNIINEVDANKDATVIISTPARASKGILEYSGMLFEGFSPLNIPIITLWPINRQRDSLEALNEYISAFPDRITHTILNGFYGSPEKFARYNTSKTKTLVEKRGLSIYFPEMAERVIDPIIDNRWTFAQAAIEDNPVMPLGNRMELKRWLGIIEGLFDSLFAGYLKKANNKDE